MAPDEAKKPKPVDVNSASVRQLTWTPGALRWHESQPTIASVLSTDLLINPGTSVIFFPESAKIEHFAENHDTLGEHCSKTFHIEPFFWTKSGWDANGFYRGREDPIAPSHRVSRSYSIHSRFLLKEVKKSSEPAETNKWRTPKYDWDFIGIYSLWLEGEDATWRKQIFLCFDFPASFVDTVVEDFRKTVDVQRMDHSPFGVYSLLLRPLIIAFDVKLWNFREPVRTLEKNRLAIDEISYRKLDRPALKDRLETMHELGRHIIHAVETLRAAATVLSTVAEDMHIYRESGVYTSDLDQRKQFRNTQRIVISCQGSLQNLQQRAQAFEDRLKNEIRLAFDAVGAAQLMSLEEVQGSQANLTSTVSVLTLVFLPGSFISGFFGTNFFATSVPDGQNTAKFLWVREMWIFWVITIPITIMGLMIWYRKTHNEKMNRKLNDFRTTWNFAMPLQNLRHRKLSKAPDTESQD